MDFGRIKLRSALRNGFSVLLLTNACILNAALVDNGDGTISDTSSGLMWLQNADTFAAAQLPGSQSNAENLVQAGFDNWRLPTVGEFEALYAEFTVSGGYDSTPFLNLEVDNYSDWFWSSDTAGAPNNEPYHFEFDTGLASIVSLSPYMALYTLPVRDTSRYTVTAIDGGAYTGNDINSTGQIVGEYNFNGMGVYIWDASNGIVPITSTGGTLSTTQALNNNNQIVGHSGSTYYGNSQAALWSNGVFTDLGTISGHTSYAMDINDSGNVVGRAESNTSYSHLALKWDASGNMTQLPGLAGINSAAFSISNNNITVGKSGVGYQSRAVMWDENGNAIDLGTTGGNYSASAAIDSSGTYVVGESEALPKVCGGNYCWYPTHPFIWSAASGMISLGDISALNQGNARATGVNANGVVIGFSSLGLYSGVYHGFVWDNGVMSDLNDLIPADAGVITNASAINDSGQIVATQASPIFGLRTVLLTPQN